MDVRYQDDHVVSWRSSQHGLLECMSHLVRDDDGRVWVIDPVDVDGLDEAIRALGEPAGVILLLDRHMRDSAGVAARLGVPLFVPAGRMRQHAPESAITYDTCIEGCPFEFLVLVQRNNMWLERALWWHEHGLLVVAEALGASGVYLARRGERLGVHPALRLLPPRPLRSLNPRLLLLGHGDPITHDAPESIARAMRMSRRHIPSLIGRSVAIAGSVRRARREGFMGC